MSRIDDALKRITGVLRDVEPRPAHTPAMEGYAPEEGYQPEPERASAVFAGARVIPEDRRPSPPRVVPAVRAAAPDITPPRPLASEPEAQPDIESEKLLDLRPVADYLLFLAGALSRHKLLAAGTFVVALALTVVTAMVLPRTYHTESKLLAQRNEVMTALSNPGRAVPWEADAPTRAAAETILRRDNLVSLVKKTDLLNEWQRTRIPVLRLKDWLMALVRRPPTPEERLDGLVGLLETRMIVTAGPVGDGTVTIEIDWPNAEMAYKLVQAAQDAFIEARQVAERAAIRESIGILENYSTTLHQNINATLTELARTQAQGRSSAGGTRVAPRQTRTQPEPSGLPPVTDGLPDVPAAAQGVPALGAELNDPEISRLKETLASKRQEIATLEAERQRQLSELQAQLARLTTVYTSAHPAVLAVQQNIAALSRDSPQLAALKAQVDSLDTEHERRVATAAEQQQIEQLKTEFANHARNARAVPPARVAAAPSAAAPSAPQAGSSDPSDFASIRLRLELNQLESVLERTDGARIELAVSDAAFKYRYNVIRPAQVPREPKKPNLRLIVIAGFFGSILLALAGVMGKDLLSGRIFAPWQVERGLGLPVLGSLGAA
jgi:uncharacterized protein involved in exopolysaccharide biosynthesis